MLLFGVCVATSSSFRRTQVWDLFSTGQPARSLQIAQSSARLISPSLHLASKLTEKGNKAAGQLRYAPLGSKMPAKGEDYALALVGQASQELRFRKLNRKGPVHCFHWLPA